MSDKNNQELSLQQRDRALIDRLFGGATSFESISPSSIPHADNNLDLDEKGHSTYRTTELKTKEFIDPDAKKQPETKSEDSLKTRLAQALNTAKRAKNEVIDDSDNEDDALEDIANGVFDFDDNAFEYIASSFLDIDIATTSEFYSNLNFTEKESFLKELIPLCLQGKNAFLLVALSEADKRTGNKNFQNFINQLKDSSDKLLASKLLSTNVRPNDLDSDAKNLLKQFVGWGPVTLDGALLIAAHTRLNKNYEFSPTLLETNDFTSYLELIKTHAKSNTPEIFAIIGSHSFCGVIEVDELGKASIVFIDALGEKAEKNEYITAFTSIFNHPYEIFQNKEKRFGNIDGSCHFFALQDILKLNKPYNLEQGLFKYLREQNNNTVINPKRDLKDVTFCRLPMQLLRITQTRKIKDQVLDRKDELKQKINKKYMTLEYCWQKDFQYNEKVGKDQNNRLTQIRDKFFFKAFDVLKNYSGKNLKKLLNNSNFAKFKARMETQALRETAPSIKVDDKKKSSSYSDSELLGKHGQFSQTPAKNLTKTPVVSPIQINKDTNETPSQNVGVG